MIIILILTQVSLMSFKKYADLYLLFNAPYWKPSYREKNESIINNRLNYFMDKDITEIKVSDVKLWLLTTDDVGNKSQRNYLSVLSGIFKEAIYDDVISKNPIDHIKTPRYKAPKINPFDADEVKQILEYSKDFNFNFVYFLAMGFYSGMRTGEILALKRNEVDLNSRYISINSTRSRFGEGATKTIGSTRKIPILNALYPYILKMYENNNNTYMLTTQYDEPYRDSYTFSKRWWRPLLGELGFEYRVLYNTRHTFATNMLYRQLCTPVELAQYLPDFVAGSPNFRLDDLK